MADPSTLKAQARGRLRAQRRLHGRRRDGGALADILQEVLGAVRQAPTVIAGFLPTAAEPDVVPFMSDRCAEGDEIIVPRTLPGSGIEWVRWTPSVALLPDRHGLSAPHGTAVPGGLPRRALVLVPALALDRSGHRLGQGGGYYDRALGVLPRWPAGPLRVGVVHPEEVSAQPLPHAPHDEPVDIVASADGWFATTLAHIGG